MSLILASFLLSSPPAKAVSRNLPSFQRTAGKYKPVSDTLSSLGVPSFLVIKSGNDVDTVHLLKVVPNQLVVRWLQWYTNRDMVFVTPAHDGMLKAAREGKGPYAVYADTSKGVYYLFGPAYLPVRDTSDSSGTAKTTLVKTAVPLDKDDLRFFGITPSERSKADSTDTGSSGAGAEDGGGGGGAPWDEGGPAERSLGL